MRTSANTLHAGRIANKRARSPQPRMALYEQEAGARSATISSTTARNGSISKGLVR